VIWGFPGGGYCCPECGVPFTLLGGHVIEQLDWEVTVRLVAHCRRQYRRARRCLAPATVTAPGPPKAIGKGLVTNGFIALLFTERYVAGRSQNSLIAGLSRHGADISPAKLAGTCAAAGSLLAPPEEAIIARSRDSWHLHADETSWHVFAPREAGGPEAVDTLQVPADFRFVVTLVAVGCGLRRPSARSSALVSLNGYCGRKR